MKLLTNILLCGSVAVPVAALGAKTDASVLKVYDLSVIVDEPASTVSIDIDLDLDAITPGKDREVVFTPMIISEEGTDSLLLPPLVVAGRNRYYYHLRNDEEEEMASIYPAGRAGHAICRHVVDFQPWMGSSTVEMRIEAASCCDSPLRVPGPSRNGNVEMARINTSRPAMIAEFVYSRPADAGPVVKQLDGRAFVSFVVNRTELRPDYMKNRRELEKIIRSIDYVRRDSDATITRVHIKGFASPEGSYSNNIRLAQGRTATLSRYVRDLYHFPDSVVTTSYEPEDWDGLRKYVKDSLDFNITHRPEILEIIDSPIDPDVKDATIRKRYPKDYAVMLKQIYPWLRHSDYTVTYNIRVYTDIEEVRRVFRTDPSRLRLVDFYTLANSLVEGSPEYFEVFEKAVEIYPEDNVANLNAANIAMQRGDYDLAQSRLLKSGCTPEADFARGVLAARRGDYGAALGLFEKAREGGIEAASRYIDNINSIRDHHVVTLSVERGKKAEDLNREP